MHCKEGDRALCTAPQGRQAAEAAGDNTFFYVPCTPFLTLHVSNVESPAAAMTHASGGGLET